MDCDANHLGRRAAAAYQALLAEIQSGRYTAGGRLPSERDLCAQLKVSRTTVRRTLKRLAEEKVIRSFHGSGTYLNSRRAAPRHLNTISLMYQCDEQTLTQIQNHALSHGYLLSVFSQIRTQWDPKAERQFLQQVKAQGHRGLLAFCSPIEPRNDDALQELDRSGVRVLHIEHYRTELPDQPYRLPDFRRAGHMAVVALLMAGYDRVFLHGMAPGKSPFEQLIEQGVTQALEEHRHGFDRSRDFLDHPTCQTQAQYDRDVLKLARSVPAGNGIVSKASGMAHQLLQRLRELKRRVPEDIGLIGIDVSGHPPPADVDELSFNRPQLLRRAIDEIVRPDWRAPRELVPPVRVKRGTVR